MLRDHPSTDRCPSVPLTIPMVESRLPLRHPPRPLRQFRSVPRRFLIRPASDSYGKGRSRRSLLKLVADFVGRDDLARHD